MRRVVNALLVLLCWHGVISAASLEDGMDSLAQAQLALWQDQPLDLNRASFQQLLLLPGVSPELAKQILDFRAYHERFESLAMLLSVPGMTSSQYWTMADYVVVEGAGQQYWQTDALTDNGDQSGARFAFALRQSQSRWGVGTDWLEGERYRVSYQHEQEAWQGQPAVILQPESVHYWQQLPKISYIVGHYRMAFSQGVTLANRTPGVQSGWSIPSGYRSDIRSARYRLDDRFFGAALRYECDGCLHQAHVFYSSQPRDLYQYDFRYGPDAGRLALLGECVNPGSQSQGFRCADSGQWYATRLLDERQQLVEYAYVEDVMLENLWGFAWNYALAENAQVGLVHYQATTDFLLQAPDIHFAPSSKYPASEQFSVTGLSWSWVGKSWQFWSELARTEQDAGAVVLKAYQRQGYWSQQWSLRHYDTDFINPYSRSEAAADEVEGLRQRDEQGVNWRFTHLLGGWDWRGQIGTWRSVSGGDEGDDSGWQRHWSQSMGRRWSPVFATTVGVEQTASGQIRRLEIKLANDRWSWRQQWRYYPAAHDYRWRNEMRFSSRRYHLAFSSNHALTVNSAGEEYRLLELRYSYRWQSRMQLLWQRQNTQSEYVAVWRIGREY